ncbi:MAG: ABC transporter substrate-binding protein, partial [Chloroflexi bacterium]|nr:ABC transporter substrate-binding protein [Chloroflexota bacterium]
MFVRKKVAMGLLASLMALVLLAVACGSDDDEDGSTGGSGEPQSGGTLRVGMVNDVFDFDPPVMVNMPSLAGLPHLYDNLVIRNPDGTLRPMLAESWETNDDASQWTFYLRKGVKFHHGKEFKAEDVIFSI